MERKKIIDSIIRLKKEKQALVLAHNYQIGEIQDLADYVGDSLQLARKAMEIQEDLIVFCGVRFMAESAKLLNPDKKVVLPRLDAGCPMADMVTAQGIQSYRESHPDTVVVTYVNSSAAVKSVSDICCTSANAVDIVSRIESREILFAPDRNLGAFVQERLAGKVITRWEGFCPVHDRVTASEVEAMKRSHPGIEVLVHPECRQEVFHLADFVGSTSQILAYVKESPGKQFIIGTERGILHTLEKENPHKEFHLLSEKLVCEDMKKITLEDLLRALEDEGPEILLDPAVARGGKKALERMLDQ